MKRQKKLSAKGKAGVAVFQIRKQVKDLQEEYRVTKSIEPDNTDRLDVLQSQINAQVNGLYHPRVVATWLDCIKKHTGTKDDKTECEEKRTAVSEATADVDENIDKLKSSFSQNKKKHFAKFRACVSGGGEDCVERMGEEYLDDAAQVWGIPVDEWEDTIRRSITGSFGDDDQKEGGEEEEHQEE